MVNKMKVSNAKRETATKQSNISNHSEKQFQSIVSKGLVEGGIHLNASKGWGKSRLLFGMAKTLMEKEDCRVLIFDGSEAWLYGFSQIPVFTIKERDIQLAKDIETTEQLEKYEFQNWEHVKLALRKHKDILFRLKSRKPSKRGFAIRTIVCYLDLIQRQEREITANHEPKQKIAYFIEEAQDAFNIRSTLKMEAEEFLTVFNEGRNNLEGFYTCCQRETDFSKTIRTKQLMAYGKIPECDKSAYMRRLEKMYSVNFSKLPKRTWFFEGETFISPTWTQNGKPYQVNKQIKAEFLSRLPKPQHKDGILAKLKDWYLNFCNPQNPTRYNKKYNRTINNSHEETEETFEHEEYSEDPDYEDPTDADLLEFGL